jgi:hypothetical protein
VQRRKRVLSAITVCGALLVHARVRGCSGLGVNILRQRCDCPTGD